MKQRLRPGLSDQVAASAKHAGKIHYYAEHPASGVEGYEKDLMFLLAPRLIRSEHVVTFRQRGAVMDFWTGPWSPLGCEAV